MPARRKLVDLDKLVGALVHFAGDTSGVYVFEDILCDDDVADHIRDDAKEKIINFVKYQYKARRFREKIFDRDLFSDPSWDMLLEVYRADLEGERLNIKSVCLSSCVPPTTALRYLNLLEQRNFIERVPDTADNRVVHVVMTSHGRNLMDRYYRYADNAISVIFK